jgi:DDE family transposase
VVSSQRVAVGSASGPAGFQVSHLASRAGFYGRRTWIGVAPLSDQRLSLLRRITRWEHEHILEAVQRRLDEHPEKMRQRRETVEHPFGTIKARMGATHFLMKTLPRVASEMALHVLAYNLTRMMNITGIQPLMAAIRAPKKSRPTLAKVIKTYNPPKAFLHGQDPSAT